MISEPFAAMSKDIALDADGCLWVTSGSYRLTSALIRSPSQPHAFCLFSDIWVSNREYSLVERKAELDICMVTAQEGQCIVPQSWDTVECISYITASWPSIHRSGFYSFTLELQSLTERFTTKIGIRSISPQVIDWYALHQHTISVHERLVERDTISHPVLNEILVHPRHFE
jgi:hypothetical protein